VFRKLINLHAGIPSSDCRSWLAIWNRSLKSTVDSLTRAGTLFRMETLLSIGGRE
jgi:hypothetical protein